jgi:capsular polysaccharide biosynthesis protein
MDDVNPGWTEFFDVCKGALQMQILRGRAWRFAAVCGLAGLVVAGVMAWRTPVGYRSEAVLRMAVGNPEDTAESLNQAEQDILSRRSLTSVIQKYDLYKEERARLPLEDVVRDMRTRNIQIRVLRRPGTNAATNAFSLAFDDASPTQAQAVTRELAAQFVSAMKGSTPLEVLDPPSLPRSPMGPRRWAWMAAGVILGLAAAAVLMGIRRWPMAPLAGLAVMLLVLPATYLIQDQWRSSAVLRSKSGTAGKAVADLLGNSTYVESLIAQNDLYAKERTKQPMSAAVALLRQNMLVRNADSRAWLVQFQYSDPRKAQGVVRDIVDQAQAADAGIQVLDPPSLPEAAVSPNRLVICLVGFLVGLLAASSYLMVTRRKLEHRQQNAIVRPT